MKKPLYLLTGVIALSNVAILMCIHNIGASLNYAFATRDMNLFFVAIFIVVIIFCIYKYFTSDEK